MARAAADDSLPWTSGGNAPLPVVFHIRHFGVGGIESALLGWLQGLDRRRFAPSLSIFLPTREWFEVWRDRVPADVPVGLAVPPDAPVVARHQARREGRLNGLGRIALDLSLQAAARRWLRPHLARWSQGHAVWIDFDHTLRKTVPALRHPVVAFRHFAFWDTANAKSRRVGRDLARYRRVLVLNDDMRRQAEQLWGVERAGAPRCVVVPNLFDLTAMRDRATAALPVSTMPQIQRPFAVCVARLDIGTKGLDTLIDAWQVLRASEPEAHLVIVGGGNDQTALQERIDRHGLAHHITLVGMQPNPYPWIAQARFLVSASRSEGAPNVLVEAMALGTPIVATDCPVGPADFLQQGACGALVPVDDVAALAGAMRTAWCEAGWRDTMSARGRVRAQDFSQERGNDRLAAVMAEVTAECQRSG